MKNIKFYSLLILASFITFSCDEYDKLVDDIVEENPIPTPETETGTSGSLDLSTYVALGASITAGATDGVFYTQTQNQSFAALLADRFAVGGVGGGAFNQPGINSVNGFGGLDDDGMPLGKFILDLDLNNDGVLGDAGVVRAVGDIPGAMNEDRATLNNFAVPGIQTAQMLTPLTGGPDDEANPAYNSLYARFASDPGTSTILQDALARNPTFWTFWPGGNDILGYAVSGGVNEAILTDPALVDGYINTIVPALLANGSKGVIINVPNVLALPFFQAVPYNAIPMDAATAEATMAGFADYNAGVQAALGAGIIDATEAAFRTINFAAGNNAILISDPTLTDVTTLSGELIPIPQYMTIRQMEK